MRRLGFGQLGKKRRIDPFGILTLASKGAAEIVNAMRIKLTQFETNRESLRGTGFEPVTPTVSV
jgi:hypothetical protein